MAMNGKKLAAFVKGKGKGEGLKLRKGKAPEEPEEEEDVASAAVEDHEAEHYDEDEDAEGNSGDDEDEDEGEPDMVEQEARRIKNGNGDKKLMKLARETLGKGRPNPAAWVQDEDIWEEAKEAVDPEGEGKKYDDPWAVVSHVYQRMGGRVK